MGEEWEWSESEGVWINKVTGQRSEGDPSVQTEIVTKEDRGRARPGQTEDKSGGPSGGKKPGNTRGIDPNSSRTPPPEEQILGGIGKDHATALRRSQILKGLMPKPYNPLGDEANSKIRFARDKAQSLQGLAGYRQSGGMQGYKEADMAADTLNPATADYLKRSQQISSDVYGDLFRRLGLEVGMLGETDQMDQGYNNLRWDFDYRNRALDQNMRLNDLAQNAGMQRAAYEGIGGVATGLYDYLREKGII